MKFDVGPASLDAIAKLREVFRAEAKCQIVHDSILPRGLADPYGIFAYERLVGYAGVWNSYDPGRLMEFNLEPEMRVDSDSAFWAVVAATSAHEIQAQTNLAFMHTMLQAHSQEIWTEKILFGDPVETELPCPGGRFREAANSEAHFSGNRGSAEFVIEDNGQIVASGGYLGHYNPPYVDVYMEVAPEFRQRGYGSYFVQEVKKRCLAAGKVPAARSDPVNEASHRTLARAGLPKIGELLVGKIRKR